MQIQSFSSFSPASKLTSVSFKPQADQPEPPPEQQGDSFSPALLSAGGAGIGTALGVYAGVANGITATAARGLVGVAGGLVGGALVGAFIARGLTANEWAAFDGMKYGGAVGALAGGAVGLLAQASPLNAAILGVTGAVSGLALARVAAEF